MVMLDDFCCGEFWGMMFIYGDWGYDDSSVVLK